MRKLLAIDGRIMQLLWNTTTSLFERVIDFVLQVVYQYFFIDNVERSIEGTRVYKVVYPHSRTKSKQKHLCKHRRQQENQRRLLYPLSSPCILLTVLIHEERRVLNKRWAISPLRSKQIVMNNLLLVCLYFILIHLILIFRITCIQKCTSLFWGFTHFFKSEK